MAPPAKEPVNKSKVTVSQTTKSTSDGPRKLGKGRKKGVEVGASQIGDVADSQDFESQGPYSVDLNGQFNDEEGLLNSQITDGLSGDNAAIDVMDLSQQATGQQTISLPPAKTNAPKRRGPAKSKAPVVQGNVNNMGSDELLEKISGVIAASLTETKGFISQTSKRLEALEKGLKALEKASTMAQQSRGRIEDGIGRIEETSKLDSVSINEIRANGHESVVKMSEQIEEMKTAVKSFQESVEELPQRASSGIRPSGANSIAIAVDETPTEYCEINFHGQRHVLLLTDAEIALIQGASTVREVVRRILHKYYTPNQVQNLTLSGKGIKAKNRQKIPPWLVELIQEAVKKSRGTEDVQPDDCAKITKLKQDAIETQRTAVRRMVSYICQYDRETRDEKGNMKKRKKTSTPDADSEKSNEVDMEEDDREDVDKNSL